MALNPLNIVLGQLPQPLGASHAPPRVYEPDKDDEFLPNRRELVEEAQSILGTLEIADHNFLGGYKR